MLRLNLPPVDPPSGVGEIFLYEMSQLSDDDDDDANGAVAFRRDLLAFLGFDDATAARMAEKLGPVPRVGLEQLLSPKGEEGDERRIMPPPEAVEGKINICDEEHWLIRAVLLEKAGRTSVWLREYFLRAEDVTVSSRERLVEILEGWMDDDPRRGRKP
mmetsp:Transcript_28607/g.84268  ORF Transcript_28607/g.84268 Transcript_28607/m.84268 type:complete len:159 (-) Transcript_28607:962-1438(-)